MQPNVPHTHVFGLTIVSIWFFVGGLGHFVLTEAEMRIVPPASCGGQHGVPLGST